MEKATTAHLELTPTEAYLIAGFLFGYAANFDNTTERRRLLDNVGTLVDHMGPELYEQFCKEMEQLDFDAVKENAEEIIDDLFTSLRKHKGLNS